MPIQLENYYNRFDPAKGYDAVLIRDGFAGQGAEINEIQSGIIHRIKTIADSLFRDGDIVRDGRISVNINTGETQCESGAIYLSGAVRGVPPATITVPLVGTVTVGVYLRERVITEQEDPSLYNPAVGSSAEGEPGAARLQTITAWGWQCGNTGDAQTGEIFPVYTLDDGNLRAKEAPPNLDAVTQALARYDRDSAGGTYVVSGLAVLQAENTEDGRQVYTISEGRARVNGFPVELPTSRRLSYAAVPDLVHVDSEPHTATTGDAQRINAASGVPTLTARLWPRSRTSASPDNPRPALPTAVSPARQIPCRKVLCWKPFSWHRTV